MLLVGLLVVGLGPVGVDRALGAEEPSAPLNASALVRVGPDAFLVVMDKKNPRDEGERLSVLTIEEKAVSNVLLPIDGLPEADLPSDLEAACAVPGRADECLLAESGYFQGKFGRVFHVRVAKGTEGWEARLLHTFVPFERPQGVLDYDTPTEDEVEGMACVRTSDGQLVLVFARRGGKAKPAELVWGALNDLETQPAFAQSGKAMLARDPGSLGDRGAADLRLRPAAPDAWRVWSVATIDPNGHGPFRSLIYDAGQLVWDPPFGMCFEREPVKPLWSLDGVKVEALAGPARWAAGSVLSIGTDDEIYGAIWRPLFQHPSP
jgi:hypothetical protein